MARARKAVFPLLALLAASAGCVVAQYGDYDYGYGYDDFYNSDDFGDDLGSGAGGSTGSSSSGSSSSTGGLGADDFYYDEYGYYGDDDDQYYEYYGYYADDFAGYGDDYYDDEYDLYEECYFDAAGKPVLSNNTASCDVKISGVDKIADKLTGGLDGVYKLSSCYNGKPMYKRESSPANEDRVLWFSSTFGDWDVSKGKDPNEAEILMYGGEMEHNSVPIFVSNWHLGADLQSKSGGLGDSDFMPITVKVACADGKVYSKDQFNQGSATARVGPILTEEEMAQKYKYIYESYRPDPSPTVNFTFVVLLVMTGLTIVLAIPYFLLRSRSKAGGGKGSKGGNGLSSSFAQLLQASKKKQSGHMN